ncbi:MAG: ferritin family protein [Spirochaetales bacterium]|nr:ferritin family protein [Spirochaetales bacterium]
MNKFKSIDEVFDFAIKNEEEAYDFYSGLAKKQKNAEIQTLFTSFANEELGHKKKLLVAREGSAAVFPYEKITNLDIGEYMVDEPADEDLDYQQALILAMKKEKKSFKLYNDLAGIVTKAEIAKLFLILAQEEARHKLRFEIEYDDNYLKEN